MRCGFPLPLAAKAGTLLAATRPMGWAPPLFALVLGVTDAGVVSLAQLYLLLICYGPLLSGYAYVINFMSDVEADRMSPVTKDIVMARQPFAAGDLTMGGGAAFAVLLLAGGLLLARHLGLGVLAAGSATAFLATLYSWGPRLKGIPVVDFVTNASMVALCYIGGWVAFKPISALSPFPVAWIFLLVTATYLLTVLIDAPYDREAGIRSSATAFGESVAVRLAQLAYLLSLPFYALSALTRPRISYYLVGIGLALGTKGFYGTLRHPIPAAIHSLARKATLAAIAAVVTIVLLYSILSVLDLGRF